MWSILEWKEARPDQKRLNGDNPLTVEAESLEDAYQQYVEHLKVARVIAKQKKEEREALRQAKLNELLSMSVIPVTTENLSLIINHLNTKNWGSWDLPKMSIGYAAHQYDCDGLQVTTITLDNPIKYGDRMVRKFKSGHRSGYLLNYELI